MLVNKNSALVTFLRNSRPQRPVVNVVNKNLFLKERGGSRAKSLGLGEGRDVLSAHACVHVCVPGHYLPSFAFLFFVSTVCCKTKIFTCDASRCLALKPFSVMFNKVDVFLTWCVVEARVFLRSHGTFRLSLDVSL
jgi:hypothetical protein